MTPPNSSSAQQPSPRVHAGFIVLGVVVLFLMMCAIGVVGAFQLGSETTVLRKTFMSSVAGNWDKKIAIRVGGITTALVRGGSRFFNLPPEPRAALDALHGAEVGVYNLREEPGYVERGAILTRADRAMAARGWDRIVGIIQEHDLVAVYMPHKKVSARNLRCCVAVFSGRDLVVVSARGNVEPLLALAEKHIEPDLKRSLLAWR
jgi:hypothetical protein